MRQLDGHELLQADDGRSYRAIVDGKFIPEQLYRMFERGQFNRVPVMLGYNAEEGTTIRCAANDAEKRKLITPLCSSVLAAPPMR